VPLPADPPAVSGHVDDVFSLAMCSDGVVWLSWADGANITGALAQRSIEAVSTLTKAQSRPLLVDLSGISGLTRDARAIYSAQRSVTAVALVGQTPVVRVIANFALGVAKSAVPTRFFPTTDEALSWLRDFRHDA
jgi:hypothetical protein